MKDLQEQRVCVKFSFGFFMDCPRTVHSHFAEAHNAGGECFIL